MAIPPPEHMGKFEMVRSFSGYKENLRIWSQLYIKGTGRTVGGWLLNSWSEQGAPYWHTKFNWFDKSDGKLYVVYVELGRAMNLVGEDANIEPDRAKFIREMVEKWELEWLKEEETKL